MEDRLNRDGFITLPFPQYLRESMLSHIGASIRELSPGTLSALEKATETVEDSVWTEKMRRCFRIFPSSLAEETLKWARSEIAPLLGKKESAINVVLPEEAQQNPRITEKHLAIYWRCVRPGKPDAGRPHRDASFWELEFSEGYNPKIPFPFDYLKDCLKIWIPLYGCYSDNSLHVIPGSHKMDIPTTVEQTEYGRRPTIASEWLEKNQALFSSPPELTKGHCILFDMNLVHKGPRHEHPEIRLSAEFNFITK